MGISEIIVTAAFVAVLGLLIFVKRGLQRGQQSFSLRRLLPFQALRRQVGMSLESGDPPLFALGRGALQGSGGMASIASLQLLQELTESSGRGQVTPQVFVGAATLLPIAQDTVRRAAEEGAESQEQEASVRFVAEDAFPIAYAAGTANAIDRESVVSSIAMGRFGQELALIGEAASRRGVEQLMGSDDPEAIAIAYASTENHLLGEELYVAGAYLRETDWDLAAVRTQDILRWLLIIAIIAAAILQIVDLI